MGSVEFLNHSIIAHRGIYNNITIYENSLESIMYAVKNNLIVEVDLRVTKDEKIIVFHDEYASRMLKLKDRINSLTKEEIDYISPYHVPTLEEVLDSINGKVPIVLDVKDDNKFIRNKLIEILDKYSGKFVIQSFIYDAIKYYKKNKYYVGLIISDDENIKYLDKNINVHFLNIKYDSVDKIIINQLKKKFYLIGWTLDTRKDVEYYIKLFNNLVIDNIEDVFK